jgi:hypothetical protein
LRLLTLRRFDVVVALTSPPLISFLAALFVAIKGGRFCFWVMDLNPDEAIAGGWLRPESVAAKTLSALLKSSMQHAERIIALDRFAKQRIVDKGIGKTELVFCTLSHDDSVSFSAEGRAAFRRTHKLDGKFVVMYSGNLGPCHPLDTLLDAALGVDQTGVFVLLRWGGSNESGEGVCRTSPARQHCLFTLSATRPVVRVALSRRPSCRCDGQQFWALFTPARFTTS